MLQFSNTFSTKTVQNGFILGGGEISLFAKPLQTLPPIRTGYISVTSLRTGHKLCTVFSVAWRSVRGVSLDQSSALSGDLQTTD